MVAICVEAQLRVIIFSPLLSLSVAATVAAAFAVFPVKVIVVGIAVKHPAPVAAETVTAS